MKQKLFKNSIISFGIIASMLMFAACGSVGTTFPTVTPVVMATPTPEPTAAPTSDLRPTAEITATPTSTPSPTPTEGVHGFVEISEADYSSESPTFYDSYSYDVNDSKYEYTVERNRVYKTSMTDPSDKTEITINYPILTDFITGYYQTRSGEGSLVLYGQCNDGNNYYVGYNLVTGESQIVLSSNGDYSLTARYWTPYVYGFSNYFTSAIFYPNDDPFAFVFSSKRNVNFYPYGKYIIVIDTIMEEENNEEFWGEEFYDGATTYNFGIFDIAESAFIAKTSLHFDNYISPSHVPCISDDKFYVAFSDLSGENIRYFVWEYANDPVESSDFSYIFVENYINSFPNYKIEGNIDFEDYIPGEVLPELSDLREKADLLEEKYGLEIFLSDECKAFCGGYYCSAENHRETIESALATMDYELSKYPSGFFQQFKDGSSNLKGVEMYLAGTLKGGDNGYTLDYAGGFRTEDNGTVIIYVDITDSGYAATFHHEISHAIETKLGQNNVDEDIWNTYNPQHDGYISPYVYSYVEDTYFDYYMNTLFWDSNKADDAFVDTYSLTYPTEDRARIFENVMKDSTWFEMTDYPIIIEKLNYFADVIRAGFDTTGWPEKTFWEKYK